MPDGGVMVVTSEYDDFRVVERNGDFRVTIHDDDIRVVMSASIAINGKDGAGVTPGGAEGWLLSKVSSVDFDTQWIPPQVPIGGDADWVLTKIDGSNFNTEWRAVPPGVPTGGATGQVLAKLSDAPFSMTWITTLSADSVVSKTGDIMTGLLQLSGDPIDPLGAVTKQYSDTKAPLVSPVFTGQPTGPTAPGSHDGLWLTNTAWVRARIGEASALAVAKAGDTMGGPLTLSGDPIAPLQATTKQYTDTKAPLTSPALQGTPTAPIPGPGVSTSQIATTEWTQFELSGQLSFFLNKAGGIMTGPITLQSDPVSALQAAPKQYVDASPGNGPYALEFDTISRSNLSRWNDHLNIAEVSPIDPSGTAGTFHTAMELAFQKALGRNRRSLIEIPHGNFRMGAVPEFLNEYLAVTDRIEFRGAGKNVTSIAGAANVHDAIRIGKFTPTTVSTEAGFVPLTGMLTFSRMTVSQGSNPTGAMFGLRNAKEVYFEDMRWNLAKVGVSLEEGTTASAGVAGARANGVNYVWLNNCEGNLQLNGTMIKPNSAQCIFVNNGRFGGGNGFCRFFHHESVDFGCDGVYIDGGYFEDFEIAVDSTGRGLVNVRICAKQFDRATTAFIRAQPLAGLVDASNRNWTVYGTEFQGGMLCDDAIIWDHSTVVGAEGEGLNVAGCNFHRIKKRILYAPHGSGTMTGIIARTCGASGTEIIRLGTAGNFELGHIQAHRGEKDGIDGFPTVGIVYDGASTGKRGHTACRFWDATVAQFLGTP